MPLPVISDVFRVTLNWQIIDGITPRNVLHFASAGTASDVGAAIDDGIANMANAGHLFIVMDDGARCFTVDILPLDGTSPATVYTLATPLSGGGGTGHSIPQACAIATLRTAQRGSRGRGRCFQGPMTEDGQANGILDPTKLSLMNAAWQDFFDGCFGSAVSCELGVASYTHADFHVCTSIDMQPIIGTQQRRLKQLR